MALDPSTPVDNDEIYDVDRFSDIVNALEWGLLGKQDGLNGYLGQTDYNSLNDVVLPADGEISITMRAPGTDSINGQAFSTGVQSLHVEWLTSDDEVLRREGIYSNRSGGEWANYKLDPKSPFARIVLENDTSVDQTASLGGHMR